MMMLISTLTPMCFTLLQTLHTLHTDLDELLDDVGGIGLCIARDGSDLCS